MPMSKKNYEKAAAICRTHWDEVDAHQGDDRAIAAAVEEAFVSLMDDNPRYDAARFRKACRVGR